VRQKEHEVDTLLDTVARWEQQSRDCKAEYSEMTDHARRMEEQHAESMAQMTKSYRTSEVEYRKRLDEVEKACHAEYKASLQAALQEQHQQTKAPPLTVICPPDLMRTKSKDKRLPPLRK